MPELNFLIMDPLQAARFRNETMADENRLDPLEVTVGKYKGDFALNARVLLDPAFASRRDALLMLDEVVLDTDTAFYVPDVDRSAP